MKPIIRFLSIVLICFTVLVVSAQQTEQPVMFLNGNLLTGNNISGQTFKKEQISAAGFGGQYFVLVQFSILPSASVQQNLKSAGILLHDYLPGRAYLATIPNNFNFSMAGAFKISSINVIPPFYKLDPTIFDDRSHRDKQNAKKIAVSFYPSMDRTMVLQQLQNAGATIIPTKFDKSNIVFIQASPSIINAIALFPFVSGIRSQAFKDQSLNYNTVGTHGISGLNSEVGKNLNGRGITMGIGDNADISSHIDFSGRLINRSPADPQDHGMHVAGILAGAGIINIKNRGMASKATLINQYFSDIITNAPTYIADNNMILTNNSYFSVDTGCAGSGEYDILSNYIDLQERDYPQLLHVIAAGNDGMLTCSPYSGGFATIKSGWQSAKNVLTVGSISSNDYSIDDYSSQGPVKDGRIKPEITASGVNITSTTTYNTYGSKSGTSMASPAVTGALSLMYERYRQLHGGANPGASLMKALVCNTAEDLGNAGPDYTYGFGMLNARRAVDAIENNQYFINSLSNGGNATHTIAVPANTIALKVMLYWADAAGAINASVALVNDLDLTVTAPGNVLHRPLILNAAPALVNNTAAEGVDRLNNIEQVVLQNPPAGSYSIEVNGFAIPSGAQEYIVSYEFVLSPIIVEYPFGGEKLVPGETESIRWSAPGNSLNNLTIDYSVNNGLSWTTIDNSVPASTRKYAWTIPPGINTTLGMIRVSGNGTLLRGRSLSFNILGSPLVTATNPCLGAILLGWPAIAGATSYDIVKLAGDSMQVIGNTSSTSWLIQGLNTNAMVWLGVAAKNGTVTGRRSVSVGILPNSGACTLAAFNNDLKVDSILEPNSARQGFANASNATRPVKILIRNLGQVPVNGPFNVSYTYGGSTVTEIINLVITAGGTYTYTFTGTYPVIAAGFKYDFKSWVSLAADNNHLNDTAYKTVKYINNDAITSMPVKEDFESFTVAEFTLPEMAIDNNNRLDFSSGTPRGRARSFVNTGFAFNGNRAITLDQAPRNSVATADSLTISYNLSNYVSKQLRFDFYYKNHGQADAPGNKVWLRGSETSPWVQAFDLFANQSAFGSWTRGLININDVLGAAVPPQIVTQTFQVKIGQEGNNSANVANAVNEMDDGYTFDDLVLTEVSNDVGITKINLPENSNCSYSATNPVSIQVKNYNSNTLNNFPVSYQVNGGAIVTENIAAIGPNQTIDYSFAQTADLSAFIDYSIDVWVKYPSDSYPANDSILNYTLHHSPLISSFPYLQNFESNDGFFYTKGTNSSWKWGTPTKAAISKAASGTKAWVTSLTGNYNDNELSYLYSPCFDVHSLTQPVLSFSHILTTEQNYDYSWVEYTTDGIVWKKLGTVGAGTNWYENTSLISWADPNTRWHVASIDLPLGATDIRFRFVLSSDAGLTEEGIGVDDIHIFDKESVYVGLPVTGITQDVNGNNWIDFSSGGKRVVSLNSHGADLGAATVQVHPYTGPVRNSNNQYYADRDIVVQTAKVPAANVSVRFYFTDAEVQRMVTASGCAACTNLTDAYQLGVTKYSGTAGQENGLLGDDTTGYFQYILPAATVIVPYDNGYYAEFSVSNFSEFWLSRATIKPSASGVCPGETMLFSAAGGGSNYQWQLDSGSGYGNISEGTLYQGTHTPDLQLINLPTSFSGYEYRCIIDGLNGPANMVRFTNIWNGNTDANWFTAANWSCGSIPGQNTEVIVPGGMAVYPLVNANTSVKSISVQSGGMVTVGTGAVLQINGR
ncbi:MAG: peptidase and in kexin sedolisin [Ferruginibacter sp.]|nr:peptidase and in kexin sedolisin [Ferruginibacter sp.]